MGVKGTPHKHTHHQTSKHGVRYFRVGEGYTDIVAAKNELEAYKDILFGRVDPPIDKGILTLMECAEVFHARAKEIEMELLELEADGAVMRGSRPYRFRTGYLRSFIEMTSKTIDLGSRRVTYARDLAQGKG